MMTVSSLSRLFPLVILIITTLLITNISAALSYIQDNAEEPSSFFLTAITSRFYHQPDHLGSIYRVFDVDRMGIALYFLTAVYLMLLGLSFSRLTSILKFVPNWSALKLLYTTIAVHLTARTVGFGFMALLQIIGDRWDFSYELQAILFTLPEYCFLILYLIMLVQWVTSSLNAYGANQIVNGSKCRKSTRILFFSTAFLMLLVIVIFYGLLWLQKTDIISDAIEISCAGLNGGLVVLGIIITLIMYCLVLPKHQNTSYVSLQIVRKMSYTVVVASIGRIFRGIMFVVSLNMSWQQSMEQNTLSVSVVSILVLCELLPLFLLLDWRLLCILLGSEEVIEAKIGDLAFLNLFLPLFSPPTTTTNLSPSSSSANISADSPTTTSGPGLEAGVSSDGSNDSQHYSRMLSTAPGTMVTDTISGGLTPLLSPGESSDLADPLLLPQFTQQTPYGPFFDLLSFSLPPTIFLPNDESTHAPPTSSKNASDSTSSTTSSTTTPQAQVLSLSQGWDGIYFGSYQRHLRKLSQIIYTNPLFMTCSGFTADQRPVVLKKFILPGLDETGLRELAIEAFTRGQLSLQCPNILPVLGFNVSGSALFLVSEYKSRRSLYDLLRNAEKNIAPLGILKIAMGIASGMECLHNNDLIHGHLTSRNILLDENMNIFVSDVGDRYVRIYAEAMHGSHLHTQWTAPEVLTSGATPTKSSDVYSFGVICWELCYRLVPFQFYTYQQLIRKVGKDGERLQLPTADELERARMMQKNQGKSLRNVVPYSFVHLIGRCFASPDLRPSFSDILSSLQRIYEQLNKISDD